MLLISHILFIYKFSIIVISEKKITSTYLHIPLQQTLMQRMAMD